MNYMFDINIAKEFGVNEAIMINNFIFWISKNKANNKNMHDGRTWTFNSKRAFKQLFPFWSDSQIKTVLNNLIKKGVLITGNYNKIAYDRTLWYSFKSEKRFIPLDDNDQSIGQNSPMEKLELANQLAESSQPIPDINTSNKPSTKQDKNKKPPRHKYGEYKNVLLSDQQYDDLIVEYGNNVLSHYIEKMFLLAS
jgi:hypothetical protein